MTEAQLEEIFKEFTKGGDLLDGRGYVKMCKDSKLLDKKFTQVDVDLIFSKAKGVGKTKINLKAWRETLPKLAERKGVSEKASAEQRRSRCGGTTIRPSTQAYTRMADRRPPRNRPWSCRSSLTDSGPEAAQSEESLSSIRVSVRGEPNQLRKKPRSIQCTHSAALQRGVACRTHHQTAPRFLRHFLIRNTKLKGRLHSQLPCFRLSLQWCLRRELSSRY
eukprot:Polyplicarium_translucidae@DN2526_c0_g1_i5.p1